MREEVSEGGRGEEKRWVRRSSRNECKGVKSGVCEW